VLGFDRIDSQPLPPNNFFTTERNLHDKNTPFIVFGISDFDAPDVVWFVHPIGTGTPDSRSDTTNGANQSSCHGDDTAQRVAGMGAFHG